MSKKFRAKQLAAAKEAALLPKPVEELPSNVASFAEAQKERQSEPTLHGADMTALIAKADANNGKAMSEVLVTSTEIDGWQLPRFQRPLKINNKVIEFCETLKINGGIIKGLITLGRIPGDPTLYKVDGQHRLHAAKMSELPEFYCDVEINGYPNFGEMAKDYYKLNDSLVKMRKDDILKAMEENEPALQAIRKQCPFVGYDNVRRAFSNSAVLSMSACLRCWVGSAADTPGTTSGKWEAEDLTEQEVTHLCHFLTLAYQAWRNDPEYYRLWGNLNLTLCMWMFRQLVLKSMTGIKKHHSHTTMRAQQFYCCLLSVSAATDYSAWLQGRNISERDRSPCYRRLRDIFTRRLRADGVGAGQTPKFPSPAWSKGK